MKSTTILLLVGHFTHINGWSLGAEILTDKERIAPDKGDHHPNKKGHELIAEVFYDKYQEIYE